MLTRTVAWQQFVACASPGYLARKRVPQRPHDLAGHDTLSFLGGEQPAPWRYQTPEGLYLCETPGRLNINSSEAIREPALA